MFADNQPPYTYDAEHSYIKPDPSDGGKQVIVHWAIKVNRLCPGSIYRTIVDARTGAKVTYDATPAFLSIKQDDTVLERSFHLPEEILSGPKIYRANAEYYCNPLQRFFPLKVQTPDIKFTVN